MLFSQENWALKVPSFQLCVGDPEHISYFAGTLACGQRIWNKMANAVVHERGWLTSIPFLVRYHLFLFWW